jgi:adenine-specific DNA-methyltransferase
MIGGKIMPGTFCDPFGGIGTVGAHFKSAGYKVYTGDQLQFAKCFQVARIQCSRVPRFSTLCRELSLNGWRGVFAYLNELVPVQGWFQNEFAAKRSFFTPLNAGRIEAIRRCIRRWEMQNLITGTEREYLLACLINSADRVANTAGTYYAFLKEWHRKAKQNFELTPIIPASGQPGQAFLGDALELIRSDEFDVVYLDPPYNERCYAGYYHLPEFIASGASWRKLHGLSGISSSAVRSAFNSKSTAADALRELVGSARFHLLVFHYSDDGLITPREAKGILSTRGTVHGRELRSIGYTTKRTRREIMHRVYLVAN